MDSTEPARLVLAPMVAGFLGGLIRKIIISTNGILIHASGAIQPKRGRLNANGIFHHH